MDKNNIIDSFVALGQRLDSLPEDTFNEWASKAWQTNKWFSEDSVRKAFAGIREFLHRDVLINWVGKYPKLPVKEARRVGVVMAGNIPAAGFHDLLSVLVAGHHIMIKSSSQDAVLIPQLVQELCKIEPAFKNRISFVERLNDADAFIATGSDNSSRYFEYYLSKKPHVIRKNRASAAILFGDEQGDAFKGLADDIFQYYGLGCRNISKIYMPQGYDPTSIIPPLTEGLNVIEHNKYANNYDYNKAVYVFKNIPCFDSGSFILKEDTELVSPIAVIYYEFYKSMQELDEKLNAIGHKLQIITSDMGRYQGSIPFGQAQKPSVDDYADKVDTMEFLSNI